MTQLQVFEPGEPATAQDYADIINQRWQDSVAGIVDCGTYISLAKHRLPHGEFQRMWRNHPDPVARPIEFSPRMGQMLMRVAAHRVLANAKHASHLPASWYTLYELSKLPVDTLEAKLDAGDLRPETDRREVISWVHLHRRNETPPAQLLDDNDIIGDRSGENWRTRLGDFDDVLNDQIETIDLIVTDPPYLDENLDLYRDLALWASKALKPGRVAAIYAGTIRLPQVIDALRVDGLEYRWTYCLNMEASSQSRVFSTNVLQRWKPIFVMYRPTWKPPVWGPDVLTSPAREKDAHPWQQNIGPVRELIERYSAPGWVVADPFLGGGTTGYAALELGRQFIGCDIDPACIAGFQP